MTSSTWPMTLRQPTNSDQDAVFRELDRNQRHLDVTLRVRGSPVSLRANLLILAASGSFFERLFSVVDASEPIYVNTNLEGFDQLVRIVKFLHGEGLEIVRVSDLVKLANMASFLNIQPVTEAILRLVSSFETDKVLELLKCFDRGETDEIGDVENHCVRLVARNMTWLAKNRPGAVLSLGGSHLGRILDQDQLDLPAEIDVWNLARKWVDWNHESKEHFQVLSSVRFGLMSRRCFEEQVKFPMFEPDPWLAVQAYFASFGLPAHISEAADIQSLLDLGKEKVNSTRCPTHILLVMVEVKESKTLLAYDIGLREVVQKHTLSAEKRYCTSLIVSPFKEYHVIAIFWKEIHARNFFDIVDIGLENNQETTLPVFGLQEDDTVYRSELAVIDGNLVLHCTSFSNQGPSVMMYKYDPSLRRWQNLRHMWNVSRSTLVHTAKDNVYAIGGLDFVTGDVLTSISCYNDITRVFEVKGQLLERRYDSTCCLWSEGIMVAFGRSRDPHQGNLITLSSIELFSTTTASSILLTQFPFEDILVGSEDIRACAFGECLLFGLQSSTILIDEIFLYNRTRDTWKHFTSIVNRTWSFEMVMMPIGPYELLEECSSWIKKRHSLEIKKTCARIQLRETEREQKQSMKMKAMQKSFASVFCTALTVIAIARKLFVTIY